MKRLIALFALFAAAAWAQPKLTVTGPAAAAPGDTVTYNVTLSGTSGNVVAVQDTLATIPSYPLTGNVTALANKSLSCKAQTCIVVGVLPPPTAGVIAPNSTFNSAAIPDGSVIQTITFTAPSTITTPTTVTITPSAVYAVDASGTAITITGSGAVLNISTPLITAAAAFSAWYVAQTQANFTALVKAIAAVQQ